MYPRTNYEMSEADLAALLDAARPVPAMMIGGALPASQQENANRAWAALGAKMGFDHMTVQPIGGKGHRFFSAVPSENETQRQDRLAREAEAARAAEIKKLENEIADRQCRLASLSAQAMSAGTAKTEGLGAKPASAVAESDASEGGRHDQ